MATNANSSSNTTVYVCTYVCTFFPSSGASVGDELAALFVGDLNPVAPKAQKKVPVPEG